MILPEVLAGDSLVLEGEKLQVIGLDPERTTLWISSLKAVVGGVLVDAGEHVWTADTQTVQARRDWLAMLERIEALQPAVIVPGHYLGDVPHTLAALRFTRGYLGAGAGAGPGAGRRRADRRHAAPLPGPAGRIQPGTERQGARGRNAVAVIHYWYDPLCGWCYGAAPLLQVAGEIPGLRIALHGGGLFSVAPASA